ncbi:NnrU family protein [Pelagibius sp.]|uniref:NnrU family protein n=1 Tax=Pelagibius sp. TaxID=1931238 RepID=UPI00262808FC|nr:NnrU family protein [Pelagibius sp.]
MIEFGLSILVFLAAHIAPAATGLRGYLIERIGRRAYLAVYSLVSLATIAWVIAAAVAAPYIEVWPPSGVAALVPVVAMLPACLLMAGAVLRPNPLSVAFAGGMTDPRAPGVLALTRHPILWAFFLWAGSHAVANGDLVALILFGALAAFSLSGMRRLERRAAGRLSADDLAAARAIARGPVLDRLRHLATLRAAFEALIGLLLYGGLLLLHGPVIGVEPLAAL